jgi:diguanylate cyclase (GGDEF)-like protein
MALDQSQPSKRLFYGALAVSALILAICVAVVFLVSNEQARVVLFDVTLPLINLAAACALFFAAKYTRAYSPHMARAWLILALAQLAYTLGDLTWAFLEVGLGQQPFPSLADGFYLLYYPLFLAGILMLPSRRIERKEWLKITLDMCMIMLAAILGIWNFLLGPLISAGAEDPFLAQLLSLAYPVSDLLMLVAILMLIYRKSEGQLNGPLLLLAFGATANVVTDCVFCYQSLLGTYTSGGFVDIGYILSYLFFGLAGVLQIVNHQQAPLARVEAISHSRSIRALNAVIPYTPYFWLLAAYILLMRSYTRQLPMDFIWVGLGVAGIIGIVLFRQILTFRENNRLLGQLNIALEQVRQQTVELSHTNRELQNEIEERMRVEEQLSYNALHDPLTGLPNRVLFMDRLEHAIDVAQRHVESTCSVLYLDLDQFKVINDSLGHSVGDQLLIGIAQRMRMCLRLSDTVARFGGDEFVILLEDTLVPDDVIGCAGRILEKLKAPFQLQDRQVFISGSLGIVLNVNGYNLPEEIIRDADIAMYHAKALGKSRFEVFNSGLRDQLINRLEIENDLRFALERNEFILNYQPVLSLETSKITGFEALLRWQHPQRGVIAPLEFIPLAEETGLIISIGHWVLREACLKLREWQARFPKNPPLNISVNISGRQLHQPDFIEEVQQVLRETGLDGHDLRLEITEGVCLHSDKAAIDIFQRLTEMGIQFQIDDFGTGYSSLSYLQYFPIRTIKIDRAFVSKIGTNNHTEIVRTIVSLAHELGMDTIAEGVETKAQLNSLEQSGCNSVQGFLFSRPVDEAGVAKLLEDFKFDPSIQTGVWQATKPQYAI